MIESVRSLTLLDIRWLDALIQAAGLEVLIVLLIPALGLFVNEVIVDWLRGSVSKVLGSRLEYIIGNYLLAAGVVIHEFSHALFAFITGAKVTEVALFKPSGNSLGHVCYYNRGPAILAAIQNCLSSCAPVVTGLVLSSLIIFKLFPLLTGVWQWAAASYLLVSVVFHMNMSKADLKNYFRGAWILVLCALPFCFVYMMWF